MSLPAPKPLSLSTSPSLGPAAARAAAQDAQIGQLVQQIRTLEHSLTQQRSQLEAEKARGEAAVNQIKERWRAESKEWRDGCDSLQAKHRIAHLGTRVALEHERGLRLEDKEVLVREKVARLLREHKITLFQARETDLVAQVATLEEEIEVYREEFGQVTNRYEAELARVTAKLTQSEEQVEELGDAGHQRKVLETELTTLRASAASTAKQVERLTLQVDNLRSQNATTETRNRELQHQVDKWQSLEGKGEKEVVELRKRRIELEVRVKELEVNLKETRSLEKKIERLETSLLETQEQVEQGQQDIADGQAEVTLAQKQCAKLERQVAKLQAALETEKTRSAEALRNLSKPSSSKGRIQVPSAIQEVSENSDDETVEAPAKPPSRRKKPASTLSETTNAKGKGKAVQHNESDAEPERGARKSKGKERAKQNFNQTEEEVGEEPEVEVEDGEILEVEEAQEVPQPAKANDRARSKDKDSDIEEVPTPTQKKPRPRAKQTRPADDVDMAKKPRSRTGKTKASDAEEQDDQEVRPKKRARSKPASTSGSQNSKKLPSLRTEETDAEDENEQPQKKKKRKLNVTGGNSIFPGPAGFTWDQDGTGDLDIPSVLSPVKDGQPIPARSGSSSLLAGWKIPWKS